MPVYSADLLPDTTGRSLGNPFQRWNADLQNLNVATAIACSPVPGQSITLGGVVYAMTAPVTAAANTTAPQALGQYLLPAGLLNATGKVLRCTASGNYTTQASQTPILYLSFNTSVAILTEMNTSTLTSAMSNLGWRMQCEATIYTSGSSGQVDSNGFGTYQYTPSFSPSSLMMSTSGDIMIGPLDLTNAQVIAAYCSFSTNTSPANICVCRQFIVEVLN
jgi:hypothetical protein